MRNTICSVVAVTALAAGCTDDTGAGERCEGEVQGVCFTEEARACLAQTPTIDTGFYGCVRTITDVAPSSGWPLRGYRVHLYTGNEFTEPTVVAIADQLGFYQLAPPPGAYRFCTYPNDGGPARNCNSAVFEIAADATTGVDVTLTVGGFYWDAR